MNITTRIKLIASALLVVGTAHAAGLDGQTLGYDYNYPTVGVHYPPTGTAPYPSSVVVGPGIEIPDIVDHIASLDISNTNLLFNFGSHGNFGGDVPFNGLILTDLNGTIPDFTSVTIDPGSTLAGFDSTRIFFDANTIRLNFVGLPFEANEILSLQVAVPEPGTTALLGLGILGVAALRRRVVERRSA